MIVGMGEGSLVPPSPQRVKSAEQGVMHASGSSGGVKTCRRALDTRSRSSSCSEELAETKVSTDADVSVRL